MRLLYRALSRSFLNGNHEIVLKSRLFVLDLRMVLFPECGKAFYQICIYFTPKGQIFGPDNGIDKIIRLAKIYVTDF